MRGICNGFEWYIVKEGGMFVAVCDGWYHTQPQPTMELARNAARVWLSNYSR